MNRYDKSERKIMIASEKKCIWRGSGAYPRKKDYQARFRWPFLYKHVIPVSLFFSFFLSTQRSSNSPFYASRQPRGPPNRVSFDSTH